MKLRETDSCDEAKNVPKVSSGKSFEMTRVNTRVMARHAVARCGRRHLIFFQDLSAYFGYFNESE